MASYELPMWHHWMQNWEEMGTVSFHKAVEALHNPLDAAGMLWSEQSLPRPHRWLLHGMFTPPPFLWFGTSQNAKSCVLLIKRPILKTKLLFCLCFRVQVWLESELLINIAFISFLLVEGNHCFTSKGLRTDFSYLFLCVPQLIL